MYVYVCCMHRRPPLAARHLIRTCAPRTGSQASIAMAKMRAVSLLLVMLAAVASSSFTSILALAADVGGGDEAAALLAFKAAAVGGSSGGYGALATWNGSGDSSTGVCGWEGVTCSGSGLRRRVVALRLPSRGLAGTLAPAVGNLSWLRTLDLSSNWLRGGIPASLGLLRRLRTLDLGVNAFSGVIPGNLTSCVSLTRLSLNGNSLTGDIPAALGDGLMRLRLLALDNNSFTGPVPASLANLTSLRYLNLRINNLAGAIPGGLGRGMPRLRFLDLCKNNLSGALPPSLYNISSLTMLDVAMNALHGTIPADIDEKLPRLEFLALFDNRFSGGIPPSISNLTALGSLQLTGNGFIGSVPRDLGSRSPALQVLHLGSNMLGAGKSDDDDDDDGEWGFITSLANYTKLHRLDISNNCFRGQLPASLVNLSATLQELYLGDNMISGSIPGDIGSLIGLRVLQIANTLISGVIPESIGKLANLTELGLHNNGLSGFIPSSVGNLTEMTRLTAQRNGLEGPIPASLGKLSSVFALDLSRNRLNGSIPKEILKLPSLSWHLNLSCNSLSGPIPSEVGSLANLNTLSLSGNRLSGQIPSSIRNCIVLEVLLLDDNLLQGSVPQSLEDIKGLRVLNLTMNKLSGGIPDALGSIHNLQELYLAYNNLSGPIPAALQNLTLFELDVSFNNLQGEVPKEGVFRNLTHSSIAGNNELCGGVPQLHLAPCTATAMSKNSGGWSKPLIIAVATTGAIVLVVLALAFIWLMCKKLKQSKTVELFPPAIEERFERVSYKALSNGTNAFSEENLLGKGSYGAVYKCDFHGKGTIAAVKVFNLEQSGSARSFVAECEALRRVRHHCLLKIITCCSSINHQGQEFKALVFEFMPNGSLYDWVHPKSGMSTMSNTLSLVQRMDIAVDIMDALNYLHNHCQPPIVHCDLKPSNILLAEDMSARVGDFGISRILPESASKTLQNSNSTIGIRGSIGYLAPEYGEGSPISTLGDVYSMGILLLEMFTGRSPTDNMFRDSLDLHKFSEAALPDRILEIADPAMWVHEDTDDDSITRSRIHECLVSVIRLGLSCSKQQPRERMPIRDAAMEMHAIRDANLMFVDPLVVEDGGEREASTLQRSAPIISN